MGYLVTIKSYEEHDETIQLHWDVNNLTTTTTTQYEVGYGLKSDTLSMQHILTHFFVLDKIIEKNIWNKIWIFF